MKNTSTIQVGLRFLVFQLQSLSASNLFRMKKSLKSEDLSVLFVISEADLNTRDGQYLTADKIDEIYRLVRDHGLFPLLALHPFKPRKIRLQTAYNLVIAENIIGAIYSIFAKPKLRDQLRKGCQRYNCSRSIPSKLIFISIFTFIWKVRPKVVFTIGASPNLAAVCEILEVKLIEVMHGAFSESELPTYWLESKNAMHETSPKPSLFFSWDSEYNDYIEAVGIKSVDIGYPVSLKVRQNDFFVQKTETVLVSLTWGLPDSYDPYGVLAPEILDLIRRVNSIDQIIRFRLHPVSCVNDKERTRIIEWLTRNFQNIEIHDPLNFTLNQSLQGSRLQITDASSTFFEAAIMGIPTIMTCSVNSPIVPREMLESGLVVKITPGVEIATVEVSSVKPLSRDYALNRTLILSEILF